MVLRRVQFDFPRLQRQTATLGIASRLMTAKFRITWLSCARSVCMGLMFDWRRVAKHKCPPMIRGSILLIEPTKMAQLTFIFRVYFHRARHDARRRDAGRGPWVDGVNGLEGVQVGIVMMRTPDGMGGLS